MVLIIPKWLITASGHIPIFFGSFLELPLFTKYGTFHLCVYYQNTLTNTRNGNIFKQLIFHISTFWKSNNFKLLEVRDLRFLEKRDHLKTAFLGTKQLVSPNVLNGNGKLRWCILENLE